MEPTKLLLKTSDPIQDNMELPISWVGNLSVGTTFQTGGPVNAKYEVKTIEHDKNINIMYIHVEEVSV